MTEVDFEADPSLGLDKWPIGYELDLDKEEWPDITASWESLPSEVGKEQPTKFRRTG